MSVFTAFERLALPVVRWLVAVWVRPSVLPDDVRSRLGGGGTLVYALEKRSVIDLAVLEYVCRERGLPDPLAPARRGSRACPGPCCSSSDAPACSRSASTAACRTRCAPSRRLAADDFTFDADIVPVSLFWGRAPDHERSWFRLLVAEGWDIGGRFRKFLSLLINGRNLLVLFGDPLPLQPSLAETRGMPRGPRRLWRQLRAQLRNQRAATIGPDLSHRRTIVAAGAAHAGRARGRA